MSNIADIIRKLRAVTALPIKQCREAAIDSGMEYEKALNILRSKTFTNRPEAAQNSGLTFVTYMPSSVAMWSLTTETDFVSKSEGFAQVGLDIQRDVSACKSFDLKTMIEKIAHNLTSRYKERIELESYHKINILCGNSVELYMHRLINSNSCAGMCLIEGKIRENNEIYRRLALHAYASSAKNLASILKEPFILDESKNFETVMMENSITIDKILICRPLEGIWHLSTPVQEHN